MKPTEEDRFPADHKVDDKTAPEAEKQRYAAASGSGTEVEAENTADLVRGNDLRPLFTC